MSYPAGGPTNHGRNDKSTYPTYNGSKPPTAGRPRAERLVRRPSSKISTPTRKLLTDQSWYKAMVEKRPTLNPYVDSAHSARSSQPELRVPKQQKAFALGPDDPTWKTRPRTRNPYLEYLYSVHSSPPIYPPTNWKAQVKGPISDSSQYATTMPVPTSHLTRPWQRQSQSQYGENVLGTTPFDDDMDYGFMEYTNPSYEKDQVSIFKESLKPSSQCSRRRSLGQGSTISQTVSGSCFGKAKLEPSPSTRDDARRGPVAVLGNDQNSSSVRYGVGTVSKVARSSASPICHPQGLMTQPSGLDETAARPSAHTRSWDDVIGLDRETGRARNT
ncbi:hypothetical protein C8Q75DRAFT_811897 [Abortiporus biennis]|nr:hypothetical protein C8Q75DRAFT_811897 [Abortiporus biennis]